MDALYRILDGELAPDELAALTLVLMTGAGHAATGVHAGGGGGDHRHRGQRRTRTRWRRLGPIGDYRSPLSWR